ncbi:MULTISPECIES: spermidine/putrescine ABC transporter ATP-binding protein PotA [Methylococcus]|uniref:Spermidine/putrescine import ATP-binding protein PotA n=1 Tax=Methylococcus capsulatus TaxID=414 RepID=A0ABZ2F2R4_METCP|nr:MULTISPECIES: spermidine/putrescine ABC transporter ATP-binding protein PotA [Methylococcus]
MTRPAIASFRAVSKRYGSHCALRDFDLDLREGELLTLLGPSGCGKTTVLRLLAGFETPDSGEIFLDGRKLAGVPPEARNVNTVFQSYALFPHLSVFENVAFGLKMRKLRGAEIRARTEAALRMVRMEGLGGRRPMQLSGGQQQRVALARALVNHPRVLLLDECLSALDYQLRREMQLELKRLQRQTGITFVFVTHDREEALSMSDRIAVMRAGRIEQLGPPRDIYERPANLFVAQFAGESNVLETTVTAITGPHTLTVELAGTPLLVRTDRKFDIGAGLTLVLRPEDVRVHEEAAAEGGLTGHVLERTYRGVTLDTLIALDAGPRIKASEFFREDAPALDHQPGQRVWVNWTPGWEIVLPHDAKT